MLQWPGGDKHFLFTLRCGLRTPWALSNPVATAHKQLKPAVKMGTDTKARFQVMS